MLNWLKKVIAYAELDNIRKKLEDTKSTLEIYSTLFKKYPGISRVLDNVSLLVFRPSAAAYSFEHISQDIERELTAYFRKTIIKQYQDETIAVLINTIVMLMDGPLLKSAKGEQSIEVIDAKARLRFILGDGVVLTVRALVMAPLERKEVAPEILSRLINYKLCTVENAKVVLTDLGGSVYDLLKDNNYRHE